VAKIREGSRGGGKTLPKPGENFQKKTNVRRKYQKLGGCIGKVLR